MGKADGHTARPLRAHVVAGFPDLVRPYFEGSMMGKARERGVLEVEFHDLYRACDAVGGRIDDRPFGGGAGMVLRPEPVAHVMDAILAKEGGPGKILPIYLGPRGTRLTQPRVEKLAKAGEKKALVLLCGHYEGVDERVLEHYGFRIYSVGDYVLSSGELAAAVLLDAVARLAPGALANDESARQESFSAALDRKREYPHYTRPAAWRGHDVPPELLSGNHAKIEAWRASRVS